VSNRTSAFHIWKFWVGCVFVKVASAYFTTSRELFCARKQKIEHESEKKKSITIMEFQSYYFWQFKAPFPWDRDEVKPEWKLKLSTCLHETGRRKSQKFLVYSPCQAIFFFRWLLLACVVPLSRLQPRPVWYVFVFTFIPVWIHACRYEVIVHWGGMTWDRSDLLIILWPKRNGINGALTRESFVYIVM
jgi:hypothetical protein